MSQKAYLGSRVSGMGKRCNESVSICEKKTVLEHRNTVRGVAWRFLVAISVIGQTSK